MIDDPNSWIPSYYNWYTSEVPVLLQHNFALKLLRENPNPPMDGSVVLLDSDENRKILLEFLTTKQLEPIFYDANGSASASFSPMEAPKEGIRYTVVYLNQDTIVVLNETEPWLSILFVSSDHQFAIDLVALAEKHKVEDKPHIHLLTKSSKGLDTREITLDSNPLICENYTETVLKDYDKIQTTLTQDKPFGRLVILDGPQGTGKSFMIRALLNALPNQKFLFIPANLVPNLSGPDLVTLLLGFKETATHKKTILIVEDADAALVRRDGTNEAEVSTLLNLTDGLMGDILDVRVVCTTNRKIEDIDKAIKRPGRLICHSYLGALPATQAQQVYDRLNPNATYKKITTPMFLGEIYGAALDSNPEGQNPTKPTFAGFTTPQK